MPVDPVTLYIHTVFGPPPRRKDETMEPPKPVFYFCTLTGVVDYGLLPNNAQPIDCMNDAEIRCCRLTIEAFTELLRRRPDPAKAQAALEIERASNKRLTQTILDTHAVLDGYSTPKRGALAQRIDSLARGWSHSAAAGRAILTTNLDKARKECADLREQLANVRGRLNDLPFLRQRVEYLEDKARRIAELRAEAAEATRVADRLEKGE